MWKFNRLSYKCMLVIALSTSAVLYMTIPGTANAMKGDFFKSPARSVYSSGQTTLLAAESPGRPAGV